jgi:hypothetical protein
MDTTTTVFQSYKHTSVDFNSAGDTSFTVDLPQFVSAYQVQSVWIYNASATIITATAGLFTAPSAGGFAIASTQPLAVTNNHPDTVRNAQTLLLTNSNTIVFSAPTLYFNVATVEGAPVTADVQIVIQML